VFPGGKIVSGSYDSSVRIWNIKSVLDKLDPVEVEDPKLAFDEDDEYNFNSKRNSLRTPR
jgi:WD40 repeat protein